MNLSTIKRLASAEYTFASIDAALSDLAATLHASAHDAPACGPAVLALRKVRRQLRKVLADIDGPLTAAVAAHESIEAPF
jgi:hypothetical protein